MASFVDMVIDSLSDQSTVLGFLDTPRYSSRMSLRANSVSLSNVPSIVCKRKKILSTDQCLRAQS